ncbi:ISL3 family transposase [Alcanivorax sp.]|jgi:transposase|uniref:ISL3 family transposase n=1 Tax=Alcanivorax sp. TaxID=1872427 RepID=UPI0032D9489A
MLDATIPGFCWEGFLPARCTHLSDSHCLIELIPDPDKPPRCQHCRQPCQQIHDTTVRRVRDRDLFEYKVWLDVPVRRLRCPRCSVAREQLDWLAPHSRITHRFQQHIEVLLTLLPIKHVALLSGLHWHTLKALDKARLARSVPEPDLDQVRFLVMDEFALFKGHRYATVVMDAERTQVLWVGEGRSREAIRPFFEWMGKHCQQIQAVAMDMNTAMDLEVKEHCPQAKVVYDLFHVVAKFGREVIDRVRVDQANQLRHDKPARKAVKRSRWLLLRNRSNLKQDQEAQLEALLEVNKPLMLVYIMKDQLKGLWYAKSERAARWRFTHWMRQAQASKLEPLIRFARLLKPYAEGVIASASYRLNTSVLEGVNNKIKVIKRMAYGYRDSDYFFLKIKAAFPGNPR